MSLMSKMLKVGKDDEYTSILSKSVFNNNEDFIPTSVPMFNVGLSGKLDGGFGPGIIEFVAESKSFKTGFALMLVKAYQTMYPDAVILFFDSEHGSSSFFDTFDINTDNVIHIPIFNIEQLKIKVSQYLEQIERGDKVIGLVDSIGTLPSTKEVEDAVAGKDTTDMTRARAMNSFFRTIQPLISFKGIPFVIINAFYSTMETYSKNIVKGGQNATLSPNIIFFITKSQVRDNAKKLIGWSFNVRVLKSRYVKENAVFPITITYDGGVYINSGILEVAVHLGFVIKPKMGFYALKGTKPELNEKKSTKNNDVYEIPCVREKDLTQEFYDALLNDPEFKEAVRKMYSLDSNVLLSQNIEEEKGE